MGNGRPGWSRWGRGSCEGYSLRIGDGSAPRFHASVVRNVADQDGNITWRADINGGEKQVFATRDAGMDHIEFELRHRMERLLREWNWLKAVRAFAGIGKETTEKQGGENLSP